MTPDKLFERWYIVPLQMLRTISNGDGGFVALATAMFLYERYANARIKQLGKSAKPEELHKQFASDFVVEEEVAKVFWKVMRDGILHLGMPMQKEGGKELPPWIFHNDFRQAVELCKIDGEQLLKVQTWLIVDKVISLWQNNLGLIAKNESFPWANILSMESARDLGIVSDEKDDFHMPTGSSSVLNMLTNSE